jgi:hypothetical protein
MHAALSQLRSSVFFVGLDSVHDALFYSHPQALGLNRHVATTYFASLQILKFLQQIALSTIFTSRITNLEPNQGIEPTASVQQTNTPRHQLNEH